MNLLNLFEDDNSTPNPNYAEELAYQIFKVAPGLDTTGAADEVLDYAFDLAVHDLGRKRAHSLFAYDEDFDSDLVNAYLDLQMNQKSVAEGVDQNNLRDLEDKYDELDYDGNSESDREQMRFIQQKIRDLKKNQGMVEGLPKAQDGRYNPDGSKKKQWHQDPRWQQHAKDHENDPKNIYGNLPKKVKEGQLNEYLVKAGMPVKDVLALNLFQDFDPVEGAAAQFPEFAQEPMWKQVVRKYAPIANMLKKKLLATKRPLTDAEAEAVEQTWYDGSDAYDDMEIEYLVDIYNQQIDTLEALLAGNLTDEEFGEGVAEGSLEEAVGMMIQGAAISGPDDIKIADQIAAKTGGRVQGGARGHHIVITYPTTQDRAIAAAKIRKMFPDIKLYKTGGNMNAIDEQGVTEADPHKFDSDVDYYAAQNAPAKPRYRGQQTPGVNPDDEDYFREIFRKKREAAAKAAQDKGVDEARVGNRMSDMEVGSPKVVYKNGKAIGEIGIDHDPSPGNGPYYMKHYETNTWYSGYPTKKEALEELKYVVHQMGEGLAEADKKKDDEPEVRDVALQRAISRAKSDFPTAGTGIEALAKGFMRSQDEDQKSFDQLRQAERKQDQMLGQIAKIDQEQEQEIQGLEQQNSGLASRLQQLQNVNSELEKKLAAMSGRRAEKKSKSDSFAAPAPTTAKTPEPIVAKTTKVKGKANPIPQKSAMKATASQLSAPKADPMAAMADRIQHGDSSILNPKQTALNFEPSDNVLEPIIPQRQQDPRFAAAKANASDVDPRYYADIAKKVAGSPEKFKAAMGGVNENDDEEADYSDKYQSMVARVGQKAREQEKSKPVDIADLARRLAAIEASKKD